MKRKDAEIIADCIATSTKVLSERIVVLEKILGVTPQRRKSVADYQIGDTFVDKEGATWRCTGLRRFRRLDAGVA